MKKWLVGPLVGAILVFLWQFLSWTVLPIHEGEAKYSAAQTEILNSLSANLKEDGTYMLPTYAPGASAEEKQKVMTDMAGKPWATVIYRSSYEMDMVMPLVRGFLIDFALVFILIYMLTRGGTPTPIRIVAGSVAAGLFTFLAGPYTMHNWFQTTTASYIGHFIDGLVAWGLCGLWLGWWLNRK